MIFGRRESLARNFSDNAASNDAEADLYRLHGQ